MRPRLGMDIAAPADLAWQQLVELKWWPIWGPTVRSARLDDGSARLSADATGSVQTAVGVRLPFQIEDWCDDEPTRSWSWRVAGVMATEHMVIDRGPAQCRVEMTVPLWGAPYLGVVAVALRRIRHQCEGAVGE